MRRGILPRLFVSGNHAITFQKWLMAETSASGSSLVVAYRMFGWGMLALMLAFVVNNFLTYGGGLPGAAMVLQEGQADFVAWAQALLYPALLAAAIWYVLRCRQVSLREDSARISNYNTVFIRAAFWVVLIVGVVDMAISFLRVEDLLSALVGEELAQQRSSLAAHISAANTCTCR